jgi:drug/metabolite transporter (DMT)-like permease
MLPTYLYDSLSQTDFPMTTDTASLKKLHRLKEQQELSFAKKGMFLALLSGMIWSLDGLLLDKGLADSPFQDPSFWLLAPLVSAGIHDFCAALFSFIYNCIHGRGKEVFRTLFSKPGRFCILGAMFGAPLGMGGYLMAVSMAGTAYTLPITSLYPAIAAVLALIFLKERISLRAWIGLASCVAGGIIISYTPPTTGVSEYFYLGLLFAFIAAIGWAAEGVCVTSGMDFIEPTVALNVYQICSSILYTCIIIPLTSFWLSSHQGLEVGSFLSHVLTSSGIPFIALAGVIGCTSYLCWYTAMNMTGVSRAMALNITYALWGVIFSAIFTDIEITKNLIAGAVIIFIGMFLVIGNPKEIVNLRKVN